MRDLPELPHNLDAERFLLGALLCDAAAPKIEAADFFLPENRVVFAALQRLAARGSRPDLVTLTDDLQQHGELEASGGAAYIASLLDSRLRVDNVAFYAQIVVKCSRRRKIISAADSLLEAACASGADPAAVVDEAIALLMAIAGSAAA